MAKKKDVIPTVTIPRTGLTIEAHHYSCDVDVEQLKEFARFFNGVWFNIPKPVRDTLKEHWHDGYGIELTKHLYQIDMIEGGDTVMGMVSDCGRTIQFHPDILNDAFTENDITHFVIAHELAHAYRHASNQYDYHPESHESEEDAADDLAREWGYLRLF